MARRPNPHEWMAKRGDRVEVSGNRCGRVVCVLGGGYCRVAFDDGETADVYRPAFAPTAEAIHATTAEIRKRWTRVDRNKRRIANEEPEAVYVRQINTSELGRSPIPDMR